MFTTDALAAALQGRYAIERLVGEGGMAKVYLARDLRHNRQVALKVLRPDLGAVVGVDRFQSEIQVTANLQHPNLLPLFDSGAAGDLLYYVMPFVEGESLRARLDREKQLPIDEAVRISTAIAAALDYAHRKGVVHRDLKPENILVHEGQPLVADFGIALAISNAGGARITQTGLSLGTPQYMSPEQATGDRAIDARTDIYSLGAVTYEMLTGEPPHVGTTSQAIIARVLTEKPRAIRVSRPSVPEHVEAAVDCALEKLPADRWATARDFADALSGARPIATTIGARNAQSPISRAREATAWVLAAALAGLVAYLSVRTPRPMPEAPPAEFNVEVPDDIELNNFGSASSIALSRDGRTLVFVGRRAGVTRLFSRRLGERFVQEIRGTEGALSPYVSPDGREVLFAVPPVDGSGAVIKRVDIAGGVARTLSDSGPLNGQLSWREGTAVLIALNGALVQVNAENGARSVLARPDTARGILRYGSPDVLPGGKSAVIALWHGSQLSAGARDRPPLDSISLGTVSIPDGKVTDLGVRGFSPRYSPSGHIVYATASQEVDAIPFDARALRVTGTPSLLAEGVGGGSAGAVPLAISDNGTMAFRQDAGSGGRGTAVIVSRTGARRVFGAPTGFYTNPRISPDGKRVAYGFRSKVAALTQRDVDIWQLDVATGTSQRLTTDGVSDRPMWSRDGAEIFFSKNTNDSVEYAISLSAGATPRAVFHAPGWLRTSDLGPAHGYAVLAVSGTPNTNTDLWIAPMDSLAHARVFAAAPYVEMLPRISPDGRFVAYSSARTGRSEVYIRPIVGPGEEVKVSTEGASDPVWSRDGRELYFRTTRLVPSGDMMAAAVTTTPKLAVAAARTLFSAEDYSGPPNRQLYDVFPNGDFLMLAARTDTGRVRPPLVVRMNWPSVLHEHATERKPQ
jgi:eukaryotic-like serine/threonine-protein kinase